MGRFTKQNQFSPDFKQFPPDKAQPFRGRKSPVSEAVKDDDGRRRKAAQEPRVVGQSRQSGHDGAISGALPELRTDPRGAAKRAPIIGIAQTGSDLVPCNRHHVALASRVRDGIRDAGGIPFVFPVHPLQETGIRPRRRCIATSLFSALSKSFIAIRSTAPCC